MKIRARMGPVYHTPGTSILMNCYHDPWLLVLDYPLMSVGPVRRGGELQRALGRATAALPGGGEDRPGQRRMAEAVAEALASDRHLVVQAGTGTGKSLAYLVPAILSSQKVVVATATKALQDQLAGRDLPFLRAALGRPFAFAVLKGRSNYLCRQKAAELVTGGEARRLGAEVGAEVATELRLEPGRARDARGAGISGRRGRAGGGGAGGGGAGSTPLGEQVQRLLSFGRRSRTGDRAELDFEPSARAWGLVSVGQSECPGRARCPSGPDCFAEAARDRAAAADVVVVNLHLYSAHLASDRPVLPDHDVVVFDEAHQLEDVATASLGLEVSGGRLRSLARLSRAALGRDQAQPAADLEAAGDRLDEVLTPLAGQRLPTAIGPPVAGALELATERLSRLVSALRRASPAQGALALDLGTPSGSMADPPRARALLAATDLAADLAKLADLGQDDVAWVEGQWGGTAGGGVGGTAGLRLPTLRVAPIEVGPVLAKRLWGTVTAVLTSATIPPGMANRLGIPPDRHDELDVGSPFPYASHGLLYCAAHLPDRRRPGADAAAHEELGRLIRAAGGRTLALFTSWRAMQEGAAAVRDQVPFRLLTQDELPKPALLAAFSATESVCLFATMGFWQGVDVPGPTLSLVVIDRLPFPRPDDPLLSARRERVGPAAFRVIDLPRAAMLLAQGAGRLIRSASDRGVVAVLDPRLARASYRWDLVRALPPMARTRHRADVERFLAEVAGGAHPRPAAPVG
ncbi:MAG: ATP-dependent DNA helicase [Acidimicrobiales bacterium]